MARTSPPRAGASFKRVEAEGDKRRQASLGLFAGRYERAQFDFSGVSPASLCDGLDHALAGGYAVTFSLTSDGGAVKVTLWANNRKDIAYAGNADTFNALLELLIGGEELDGADDRP